MKKIKFTKNLRTENTEKRILKHATKLFLKKGYHGTSIDDITREAGVRKGGLYWHFRSKDRLLKRITKEFEKRFLDGTTFLWYY